ncbi:MAG: hypothetical protein ACK4SO_02940 [Candidatus Kapaibacteriota bacterium]
MILLLSCQEGLDPTSQQQESYLKGNVVVISGVNSWPKLDSALELRVVGFKEYPPQDLFNDIISNNAFISDSLPRFVDTIPFQLKIEKPPVEIRYLVAALRYGTIFEWKVIGVYSDEMTYERKPKIIFVPKGKVIENITILVDFRNLPKQPF